MSQESNQKRNKLSKLSKTNFTGKDLQYLNSERKVPAQATNFWPSLYRNQGQNYSLDN